MKNMIIAFGLVIVIVLSALVSLTVYSYNARQNEVEEALTVAVEQALKDLVIDQETVSEDPNEFVADFVQWLVLGIDSDSEITVNILAMDLEKGLLDVEVIERFQQVNGSIGTASYRKTVILDQIPIKQKETHSVKFMVEDGYSSGSFKSYKEFTLTEGANVIFPGANPSMEGYAFVGWSLTQPSAENNYSPNIISAAEVSGDMVFYAVFN